MRRAKLVKVLVVFVVCAPVAMIGLIVPQASAVMTAPAAIDSFAGGVAISGPFVTAPDPPMRMRSLARSP